MTDIEKLTNELSNLRKTKDTVSENLKVLKTDYLKVQAETGDKLIENKATSTKALDELQAEIQRNELVLQALDRRIDLTENDRLNAITADLKVKLAGMKEQSDDMLLEIVKAINTLHELTANWINLSDEYQKRVNRTVSQAVANLGRAGKLPSNGLPTSDIVDKTDLWLTNAYIANVDFQEKLKQAGILTSQERKRARARGKV